MVDSEKVMFLDQVPNDHNHHTQEEAHPHLVILQFVRENHRHSVNE